MKTILNQSKLNNNHPAKSGNWAVWSVAGKFILRNESNWDILVYEDSSLLKLLLAVNGDIHSQEPWNTAHEHEKMAFIIGDSDEGYKLLYVDNTTVLLTDKVDKYVPTTLADYMGVQKDKQYVHIEGNLMWNKFPFKDIHNTNDVFVEKYHLTIKWQDLPAELKQTMKTVGG